MVPIVSPKMGLTNNSLKKTENRTFYVINVTLFNCSESNAILSYLNILCIKACNSMYFRTFVCELANVEN